MRLSTALLSLTIAGLVVWIYFLIRPNEALVFPNANSRDSYVSVHNIRAGQGISKGRNAKVGILDHNFGSHLTRARTLYAGGANFVDGDEKGLTTRIDHGYWLALTLREIAPEVDIYSMNTASRDERATVGAMVQGIDWAIRNKLDVLTYSGRSFSPDSRRRLDAAVDRAVAAGIVVVFIHYPHQRNLLPGPLAARPEDGREPDVRIYPYDYTVLFAERYAKWQRNPEGDTGYRPFLSLSSMAPVTAGVVAMMRSLDPGLSPAACKQVLIETSRTMDYGTQRVQRVMDAGAAVERVSAMTRSRALEPGTRDGDDKAPAAPSPN